MFDLILTLSRVIPTLPPMCRGRVADVSRPFNRGKHAASLTFISHYFGHKLLVIFATF